MDQMSATQDSIQRDPQTLCIKHLAKNYNKRWVVKDVSFQMKSGEIVGLLGPNGAGKTTSFYMVVGLVRMDKGEIAFRSIGFIRPCHA